MEPFKKCQTKGLLYNKKTRRCYKSCEEKKKVTHPVTKKCRKPCKSDKIRRIEDFRCVKNTFHLPNLTYDEIIHTKNIFTPTIKDFRDYMPMKLPKTVIVAVTTHGEVILEPKQKPLTARVFELPPKMTLTSISSVTPGVCLFLSSRIMKVLIQHLYNNKTKDLTKKSDILRFAQQIAKLFKTIQNENNKVELKEERKIFKNDTDYTDYLHHNDKSFVTDMYTKTALNKRFAVRRAELKPADGYFNKVNIIVPREGVYNGLSPANDIFEVKTEKLMQMLNENGVKNVILLDLSCSPFNSKINERESRVLARDLLKKGLHGGRD